MDQDSEKCHGFHRINPEIFQIHVVIVETNIRKKILVFVKE